uniref:Uncharacterized protein n=1 Tax=Arundo donax TaxID=35708 RepID=A0A0A9I0H6_ARUDO
MFLLFAASSSPSLL